MREEDSVVREFALETLVLRPRSSNPEIFEEVKAFAEERGYPVIPASTLAAMRGGLDRQVLTASAFGRKAAELDTMQKGVLPSKYPH